VGKDKYDIVPDSELIFFRHVKSVSTEDRPMFEIGGINFIYVKKNGMYTAVTTRKNSSPLVMVELLNRALTLFKDFSGVLSEESLRFNFTLMYEIVDEMIDSGLIQNTSTQTLSYYVMNPPVDLEKQTSIVAVADRASNSISSLFYEQKTAKSSASNRPVTDKTDDIYVDVLEKVNVEFNRSGTHVLRSEIIGSIVMKSFLRGCPLLKFGLNQNLFIGNKNKAGYDHVVLDQVNFNSSVNTSEFERDRVLSLYPVDGEFTVMNYRVTGENATRAFTMPIRIFPHVEMISENRVRVEIRIRADLDKSSHASNIYLRIPLPKFTDGVTSVAFENFVSTGNEGTVNSYEYKADEKVLTWAIKRLGSSTDQTIMMNIALASGGPPSRSQLWFIKRQIGPISAKFEVPMHNVSGVQMRFLKIGDFEDNKEIKRWVRYVCQGGNYVCRVDEQQ
jgi:AP-4 complex subunit mu-1